MHGYNIKKVMVIDQLTDKIPGKQSSKELKNHAPVLLVNTDVYKTR